MELDYKKLNKVLTNDSTSNEVKRMISGVIERLVLDGTNPNNQATELLKSFDIVK